MPHPHLTALDTLVGPVEDQTGAQQVSGALHPVGLPVEAPVRKEQSSSVPPVLPKGLLTQTPVGVQSWVAAPVSIEGNRPRAPVHLHAGMEALLHQGPQPGPRVATPGVRPEGDGKGLSLIHQRRERFLRIDWREGMKI